MSLADLQEVFVAFADLVVGDVVCGLRLVAGNGKEVRWGAPQSVLKIDGNVGRVDLTGRCYVLTEDATHFLVVRSIRRANFPHHCTR